MGYIYGVQPIKWLRFDGSNIQQIADEYGMPGTVVDGTDRIYLTGTGSGDFDITFIEGDLAGPGPYRITADDWNLQWSRITGPGEGNA